MLGKLSLSSFSGDRNELQSKEPVRVAIMPFGHLSLSLKHTQNASMTMTSLYLKHNNADEGPLSHTMMPMKGLFLSHTQTMVPMKDLYLSLSLIIVEMKGLYLSLEHPK